MGEEVQERAQIGHYWFVDGVEGICVALGSKCIMEVMSRRFRLPAFSRGRKNAGCRIKNDT